MNNRIYWKISLTFLGMLIIVGIGYVMITGYVAKQYMQEANQKLYGGIADTATIQLKELIDEEGNVDTLKIKDLMHSLMVINPSIEVYLLDKQGNIITHVAPFKRVKLTEVNLKPVKKFISKKKKPFIKGDDPRHPGEEKVFSAAKILDGETLTGYLYIILASEEQAAVTDTLFDSYMLKMGVQMFIIALLVALILGLLAIWYLTKNLSNIIEKVRRFKEGDYDARIENANDKDLSVLSNTFNEMADTIVANMDELKSVEKLRRELIANVSHDLRTPLAIMQGFVETLLIKNDSLSVNERAHYLNIVLDSSDKLKALIAQLFEYSKLEAKQIEAQKEAFFISDLVQDIFHKYQVLAQEKSISLEVDIPKNLPLVFADISLVDRVLQNLIDNALKFTPNNGTVRIVLQKMNESVEVKIADNGPGMSEEAQSAIFERYNKSQNQANLGAGLGLAIVKKILELHDATIKVQSQLNKGTAFMFELPAFAG
jgi:signal transduction histidine kinase